jgi:hypothetical protein
MLCEHHLSSVLLVANATAAMQRVTSMALTSSVGSITASLLPI